MREFYVLTVRILPFGSFRSLSLYSTNKEKNESVLSIVELGYDVIKGTEYCVSL
jgi:hypothetical protein